MGQRANTWTKEEDEHLLRIIKYPEVGFEEAAEALGRTPSGVIRRLRILEVRCPIKGRKGLLTTRQVAEILGLSVESRRLYRWLKEGTLRSYRLGKQEARGSAIVVSPEALIEFIEKHSALYERAEMPEMVGGQPNFYKQLAPLPQNSLGNYLTPKQVARKLNVCVGRIGHLIRTGQIPHRTFDLPGVHPHTHFVSKDVVQRLKALDPKKRWDRVGVERCMSTLTTSGKTPTAPQRNVSRSSSAWSPGPNDTVIDSFFSMKVR
jgi:excisionase family DNA binding protein